MNKYTKWITLSMMLLLFCSSSALFLTLSSASTDRSSSSPINGQTLTTQGTPDPILVETPVNTYTSNGQQNSAISRLTDTTFVVVWESSGQDTSSWGVYGTVFNTGGFRLTPEFQVNTVISSDQVNPSVSRLTDTTFVVVWESYLQDGDLWGVFATVFNSAGARLGAEFQVNNYTTSNQMNPSVSRLTDTTFVITWDSFGQDGSNAGVYAAVFNTAGANLTSEFRVNNYFADNQRQPSVSRLTDTTFVVAWTSTGQDGSSGGVYAKVFNTAGANFTSEFRVNTYTTDDQSSPSVSRLTNTSFVVSWASNGQDGSSYGVYAKVFNTSGANLTSEFRVNNYITDNQRHPSLSRLTDTTFVVAWTSSGQDGSYYGIYAMVFDTAGANLTSEFKANTYILNDQIYPCVTSLTDTTFVIAWQSQIQDGWDNGVFLNGFSFNPSTANPSIPGFDIFIILFGFTLLAVFLALVKKEKTGIVSDF